MSLLHTFLSSILVRVLLSEHHKALAAATTIFGEVGREGRLAQFIPLLIICCCSCHRSWACMAPSTCCSPASM